MIGSSSGFQYTETSDVDLQVFVKMHPGHDFSETKKLIKILPNGNNLTGTDFIQCSTRGSVKLTVNRMNVGSTPTKYGYVNNSTTGKTEIWVRLDLYNYDMNMVVTNSTDCSYGNLARQTTEPEGIVYITPKILIDKNYIDTNFLQFDVIEEF